MPTLYAVLVAINDYPTYPLKGCINDKCAFQEFLEDYCDKNRLLFRSLSLENEEATRKKIITSFDHYRNADADDICLFYFAGHGSHYPVPDSFKHLEPDSELETIVCYDSRLSGGQDLVDKELSYLIWEVCLGSNQPFITIMDCCHSGAFRATSSQHNNVAIREIVSPGWIVSPNEFLGYENYRKDEARISPPNGRRIHLGAARDLETAKEVLINGKRRGIFTYSLLQILHQTSGVLPYDELIKRINQTVRKAVSNQSSQLLVTNTTDKRLIFLTDKLAPEKSTYLVSHDLKHGWIIDAGSIHGMTAGGRLHRTKFKLIEDNRLVEVLDVAPTFSKVGSMIDCNTIYVFHATLEELAAPLFKLSFSLDSTSNSKKLLSEVIEKDASDMFWMTSNISEADFLIHADDYAFSLIQSKEKKNIGKPIIGVSEESANTFLKEVEIMLKWYQVLLLENTSSSIKQNEFEITLNQVIEAGNYEDGTGVLEVDLSTSPRFNYIYKNGEWHQPAFQLNVKNIGYRPLSVGLLYLGTDFSITNQLLQLQILEPGHDVWAMDYDDHGNCYISIQLQLEDYCLKEGIDSIDEYLKLIICTEPFDSDRFNQDGIIWHENERNTIKRTVNSRRGNVEKPDWITVEIPLLVHRSTNSL